ncbi:hypothetical protein H5410_021400, partial [Solanum commersonii]
MAHMEQELEILREELHQVRDLAKLSVTTLPTFKTPIYFPKAEFPSILGKHVAALYKPHVPPVYTDGPPTFITPAVVNVPYEVDQYAEMEKNA